MRGIRAAVPSALSLSRLPLGMGFLLLYDTSSKARFLAAVLLAILALLTDVLDGRLARRWSVASETGALIDGLGDKAFYIAVYLVVGRVSTVPALLLWSLIFREVALYGLRSIDPESYTNTRQLRWASLTYAAVIRLYFLAVFAAGACRAYQVPVPPWLAFGDILAYLAAFLGYVGLFKLIQQMGEGSSGPDRRSG
jgi:phosphatidylglycerophosphate synthase